MDGINKLMLGKLGQQGSQGAESAGSKFSSRGKNEMEFHSLLGQKTEIKPKPAAEPAYANKSARSEQQNTSGQNAQQPNETANTNKSANNQSSTETSTSKSQSSDEGQGSTNEQIAAQVKEAVDKAGDEVDPKEVVAQVLADSGIDLSQLNLDELFADIEAALSELNLDTETLSELTSQLTELLGNAFSDIAGQISQKIAQLDPTNEAVIVEDEEVLIDETEAASLGLKSKDKSAQSGLSLETDINKKVAESASKEAKGSLDKSTNEESRLVNDFEKKTLSQLEAKGNDIELKDKLNLNKTDFNFNKTPVQNNNVMGGVSNINQINQVQSKIAQAQQMSVAGKLGSTEFKQGLSEKVVFMLKGEINSASLKLNPPELGPLEIKLNMNNTSKQADLTIMTQHALVKDSVEQALPRLRDMLADSGIQLNNVNVSDQNLKQNQQQSQQGNEQDGSGSGTSSFYQEVFGNGEQSDEEIMTQLMIHRHRPDGLVDYYA